MANPFLKLHFLLKRSTKLYKQILHKEIHQDHVNSKVNQSEQNQSDQIQSDPHQFDHKQGTSGFNSLFLQPVV